MAGAHPGRHPAARPLARGLLDGVAHLLEEALFVGFPHLAMALGIGAAMADELVATRLQRRRDLRRVVEHRGVDQVGGRQVELVEQFQAAPHADAVAIVAPGEGARIGRRARHRQQVPIARAEGEMLDVEAEIDRQPLAAGPGIVRPLDDRGVGITIVIRQAKHMAGLSCKSDQRLTTATLLWLSATFIARKRATASAWSARSAGPASSSGRRSSSKLPNLSSPRTSMALTRTGEVQCAQVGM